jgi:hypothetical protein
LRWLWRAPAQVADGRLGEGHAFPDPGGFIGVPEQPALLRGDHCIVTPSRIGAGCKAGQKDSQKHEAGFHVYRPWWLVPAWYFEASLLEP